MPGLRGTTVAVAVMAGVLGLTGCQDSSGSHAGSSAPSAHASAPSDTPAAAPSASATPTPTPTRPAPTPTPSHASAVPAVAASPAPAATRSPSADRTGCRNLTAGSEVKAAVTEAYRRGFPRFVHVRPVPRQFFLGRCDGVRYAATRFEPTAGATHEELVGMQDEGSATKYFRGTPEGGWTYLTSDAFPHAPRGCGDVPQIPEALAELWGNCAAGH
ncbi:hypothetical protein GCM10010415_46700 [Streptomyces atrovirens]|uniref:Lipoprotein n=1 Tax=Streptomyces atrovirens TaxID=285556 RepID=A0ABW0E5V0_9ACTN